MSNRLARAEPNLDRPIPPQGHDQDAIESRIRFWINRGNDLLREQGRTDLQWSYANGAYFIEPRR